MNLTYCEGGKMHFGLGSLFLSSSLTDDTHTECKPGVDCAGDITEVPIPPCVETDAGRDYITFGTVLSGVNLDDLCMGDILRERYCYDELTYTSEDIDCTTFGAGWTCEEGECREGTPVIIDEPVIGNETDCGDGIDNDGDGLIDCADPDCNYAWEDGGCGDFEYSCGHNPTNPYPFCGGTCPVGEECVVYYAYDGTLDGGWCECMPEEETSCGDSVACDGWCLNGDICVGDDFGCFCTFDFGVCEDTDGGVEPLIGGIVTYLPLTLIDYCVFKTNYLVEYACGDGLIIEQEIDCAGLGLVCIDDEINGAYCGEVIF